MVAIESTPEMAAKIYAGDGAQPRRGAPPIGQAVDAGRQGVARASRRSGAPGDGAGRQLSDAAPRPRRVSGRARPDRAAAIHADATRQGRGAGDDPLRPPDPGAGRGRRRSARVARRKQGGLRLSALGRGEIRAGLLGAGRRHHPSGGAGELRLSGRADHRHRLAHAQCRRSRRVLGRRRRRGRGRGHRRAAVGGAVSPAHRGLPDRPAERMDGAQGRDPLRRRPADRLRRDQRHRRVYRPRRAHDQRHRQGDDHQYGRRARRDDLDVPGRRAHGALSAGDRQARSGAAVSAEPAPARTGQGGRGRPGEILRPRRRARSVERSNPISSARIRRTGRGRSPGSPPRSPIRRTGSSTRSRPR